MQNNIMENETECLERVINSLFYDKEVVNGLKNWYGRILKSCWDYVVFVTSRSYCLALIMERITGKAMEERSDASFLTDGAFFLHCHELADRYRKTGKFPHILLCDDVMAHGRYINHMLEVIVKELCRILGYGYDKNKVEEALSRRTTIHVYSVSEYPLLYGRWEMCLTAMRRDKPVFWHQLMSDIASLISRANIVNTSYIFTEYLSDEDMEQVNLKSYVSTVYQNIQQYTKCDYAFAGSDVKAAATLRIIKNVSGGGYRVAPFFFLPNLDTPEHLRVFHEVTERIPDEEIKEWIWQLEGMEGKRTCNELISLLFSNAILQEFCEKNNLKINAADRDRELNKLARNYDQYGLAKTRKMLKKLLEWKLFSVSEIMELFVRELPEERIVMRIKSGVDMSVTKEAKREIRDNVEDYFYGKGHVDEESAYELTQQPYFRTRKRSKRRAGGCCFTLTQLNAGYTLQESIYCMSYLLQMMDADVADISSYAPNDVRVVGYAQFIKAGSRSLETKAIRNYRYLGILSLLERSYLPYKVRWNDCLNPLLTELQEYCQRYPKLYSEKMISEMEKFLEDLKTIGQTSEDWGGNYGDKVEEGNNSIYGDIIDERRYYATHCRKYLKKKKSSIKQTNVN